MPADPLAEAVERLLAFVEGVHGARLVGADLRLVLSALASRDAEASAMRAVVEAVRVYEETHNFATQPRTGEDKDSADDAEEIAMDNLFFAVDAFNAGSPAIPDPRDATIATLTEERDRWRQDALVNRDDAANVRLLLTRAEATIADLRGALAGLADAVDDLDSEDHGPRDLFISTGCLECTSGTTPDRLNTGPCAYQEARSALSRSADTVAKS